MVSFKGGEHLLTDPQLILLWVQTEFTLYSELGTIFSDGNLNSAHVCFTSDQTCNKFCKAFGLEVFQDSSSVDAEKQDGKILCIE